MCGSRWIAAVLCTFVMPLSLYAHPAESGPGQAKTRDPSHLAAQAELAHYATYYAASFFVRDLGRQMSALIRQRAATGNMSLPSEMNCSDRQMVHRFESLQGDDFDVAYMNLILNARIGPSGVEAIASR